jgi:SAM-dependent methyltransferase
MNEPWPAGFARVPDDDWTRQPIETLALKYDTVENHGWYHNLDRTVEQLDGLLRDGDRIIDYSGGTGIFADRLLQRIGARNVGILIVDASAKFLRLSVEKFRNELRLAFRLIRFRKDVKRLEYVDEVTTLRDFDAVVSTNAIHLYYDLLQTLQSWIRVLRPGAHALIQSGNIRNPAARPGEWIIDETVEAIHDKAAEIAREDPRYSAYAGILDDAGRMAAYGALRSKYFIPVRPLDHYLRTLREAGFTVADVSTATIPARVDEWYQFLSVYHEGVLGWVGGVEKIEAKPPAESDVRARLALLKEAMHRLFRGQSTFDCCWTYITCRTPGRG